MIICCIYSLKMSKKTYFIKTICWKFCVKIELNIEWHILVFRLKKALCFWFIICFDNRKIFIWRFWLPVTIHYNLKSLPLLKRNHLVFYAVSNNVDILFKFRRILWNFEIWPLKCLRLFCSKCIGRNISEISY